MLGWSINLFRIRGIQLAVHFSFLLLLAFVGWQGWQDAGASGILWYVAVLLLFFTCVVLHELGHSFTAQRFGVRVSRILLMPIGGMAEFDAIPRRPRQELLITLAGPAVNFAIAALLWLFVGSPGGWLREDYPATISGVAHLLLHVNLLMGCFNLLPVFPMDGGRIFRAALASRMPYLRATQIAAAVGKVLAVIAALAMVFWIENYLGAALFVFIFVAGELELQAVRRREMEAEYWRAALVRLRAQTEGLPPPALIVPPQLESPQS